MNVVKKLDADQMRALMKRLDDLCILSGVVRKQLAKITGELRVLQEKIVSRTRLIFVEGRVS